VLVTSTCSEEETVATVLYRLGRFCHRARRLVGSIWLAVIVLVAVGAATLSGPSSASFDIGGAESQRAFDLLDERFPELHAGGAAARLVFAVPEGERVTDARNAAVIEEVIGVVAAGPQVGQVLDPFGDRPLEAGLVSEDATMALAEITFTVDPTRLDPQVRAALDEALALGRSAGLTVEAGGTATEDTPAFGAELLGLLIASVVLVLTFGSPVAAGIPMLTGVTAVGVALAAITALTGLIPMSDFTPLLAIMIGLAVGIDYALFILSRYRHELMGGVGGEEAAGRALGTAGTAVVFAAFTVVVALAALSFNNISLLTEMGLAAAFTVLVALAISLTLLPALAGFAGRTILAVRLPGRGARDEEGDGGRPGVGRRWVQAIVRRPLVVMLAAVAGLALLAMPVRALNLGFIDEGSFPEDTTQRRAFDLISEGFGPGASGHLLVVVDATGATDPRAAIEAVGRALGATGGVLDAFPPQLDAAGSTGVIVIIPAEGPASRATIDLVHAIRSDVAELGRTAGAEVVATGSTALQIDVTALSSGAIVPYLLVLVGLSALALLLVFRSVTVPLIATGGFLLTIAATFGVMVGIYQWGWLEVIGLRPVGAFNSLLPLVIVGVAFGLAMDYQFFLTTRIREAYVQTRDARGAIVAGFAHTARVVAAAAAIMIAVFGAFGLLNDSIEIAQIGLALAVAIAVDAFVVRMTMIPALLAMLGHRAWWLPRWLDRILPDVDVEGRRLADLLASHGEAHAGQPARSGS
jgi:RND superfamily putative drug exporter